MTTENNEKTVKGYRIMIGLLVVILAAISALYFNIHSQQQTEYNIMIIERDSVQSNLAEIMAEYDKLETSNDQLNLSLQIERNRVDSVNSVLTKERSLNYTKLKQYERELGTLRATMRDYLKQIDSLNSLNEQLISENVSYKKKITKVELRAEEAEERARELDGRLKEGARLRAEAITITALNKKGRKISRVKRAERLSINFSVVPNELAAPGNKNIYARVTSPDGYVLTTDNLPALKVDGKNMTYSASRVVDYQNATLPVSIFFAGEGFVGGVYKVELFFDGYKIGESEVSVR